MGQSIRNRRRRGSASSVDDAKVTYSRGGEDYFEKGAWVGRVAFSDDAHVAVSTPTFQGEANVDDSFRLDDAASLTNVLGVSGNDAASLRPLARVCSTLDAHQDDVFEAISTHDGAEDAHTDAKPDCNWAAVWARCASLGYESPICQMMIDNMIARGC